MPGRLGVEAALVDGVLVAGDVEIADGRIAAFGLGGKRGRGFAVPGFVDLQVNGFGGVDFLDADAAAYRRAGDALLETGVTAYLPTLITSPEEQVLAAMREVPVDDAARPRILGMHLEGPFLSPNRLGTHEASSRRDPDLPLLERLLDAGPVRLMTLAPELAGAGALIDVLLARGVVVSLGHTDANVAQANAAFDAGARGVTHLFNAMRPLLHRDPGHRRRGARPRRRLRLDHHRRHPSGSGDRAHGLEGGARAHRARLRRDRRSTAQRRPVDARRARPAGARRRGPRAGRRARRQRADDDRSRPQPARSWAPRSRTRSAQRRSLPPGCSATRSSAGSTSGYPPTSSC